LIFGFPIPVEYQPHPKINEIYNNQIYCFIWILELIECYPGETFNKILHFCSECSQGQYSFNPTDTECQNCPSQADSCYGNITDLKPGYWRSPSTSLIYQCDLFADSCL